MQGKEELIHGLHATKNSTNHWEKTENKKEHQFRERKVILMKKEPLDRKYSHLFYKNMPFNVKKNLVSNITPN